MVVADKTAELYKTTYWASYNIPYVAPLFSCHPLHPSVSSPRQGPSPGDILNMLRKETSASPAGDSAS